MWTCGTRTEVHAPTSPSARAEWRAHPLLPVAAGLGYATSVIHIYGIGPFYGPVAAEFGWSRTEVTFGLTLATLVQAVGGVFIGLAVDRFGPRRFGVVGLVLLGIAFALLGTADGSLLNWYLLWGLVALAALPVQASVWTSAVASRFTVSRGMAFAVTLCGASIAAGVFPPMATWLIGAFGWRGAFPVQAAIWLGVAFPVIFVFFHGRYDRRAIEYKNHFIITGLKQEYKEKIKKIENKTKEINGKLMEIGMDKVLFDKYSEVNDDTEMIYPLDPKKGIYIIINKKKFDEDKVVIPYSNKLYYKNDLAIRHNQLKKTENTTLGTVVDTSRDLGGFVYDIFNPQEKPLTPEEIKRKQEMKKIIDSTEEQIKF